MAPSYNPTAQRDETWYRAKVGEPVHERVVPYGRALLTREANFHAKNLTRERVYRGVDLQSQKLAIAALSGAGLGIARLNAIKAIGDTFASRLSKDRPMPGIVVDDSDFELKKRAKKYREFIVGQMRDTEFDALSTRALQDGVKLGIGFTRVDDSDEAVIAERIPVNDLLFDRRELKYGKPRQAIRIQRVARDHLAELFPKSAEWIIERTPASLRRKDDSDADGDGPKAGDLDQYVDTWEAWFPPMVPDSDIGRHVLCVEGKTLVSEQWHEPRFPWSMFQLGDPDWGLYPEGFVDLLIGLQHRVNLIVRDIQLNLAATGRGIWMVNKANDIPVEMLAGASPYKVNFNGPQPPQYIAPQPYNVAQMSALDKFIGWMFDLSGVSRANAESRSTLGAGASGVALDTQYDIDSDRFRIPQANYARYRMHGGQCYLDASARVARRRYEGKGAKRSWVATTWKSRDAIQQLDYSKVVLKEGSYRLRIEPIGFIPDTRAGKIAVVEQLAKAGVIPQWLVPMLFDEPDLAEANRILLAPLKNCLRKMDLLAEVDEPLPMPEQYNDIDIELKVSVAFYNWIQCENAGPEIQERYRTYCDLVTEALKARGPAAAPAAMAPAEQPMPGGVPLMPQGPVMPPAPIGAPPLGGPMPMPGAPPMQPPMTMAA
jgi:hypothetical protein